MDSLPIDIFDFPLLPFLYEPKAFLLAKDEVTIPCSTRIIIVMQYLSIILVNHSTTNSYSIVMVIIKIKIEAIHGIRSCLASVHSNDNHE